MNKLLPILLLFIISRPLAAQNYYTQSFDGNDTMACCAIFIEIDTAANNIWQIGEPDKMDFSTAYSVPNVIVTDTINNYPINNVSRFRFKIATQGFWGGQSILALQWAQKLEMDAGSDGGIVEYSVDSGATWINVFNNPYVYNFYGFDQANEYTLPSGEVAFSGDDTDWKDIWLCFDINYFMQYDSVLFQFTFKSDSVDTGREGWMIDNLGAHMTIIHTAGNEPQKEYMKVYPTITSGTVYLEGQKLPDYHIIEHMELLTTDGKIVKRFGKAPVKFYVDVSDQPDGYYLLRVTTNVKTVTEPVILMRQK